MTSGPPSRRHGDLTDDELIAVWQSFRRAAGALDNALVTDLRQAGAPDEMWCEALTMLARAPDGQLTMSELAAMLGLSSGAVTKLVDRLTAEALVRRAHCSRDRRAIHAVLTRRGTATEEVSTPVYAARLRADLGRLGPRRLASLRELSARVEAVLADRSRPRRRSGAAASAVAARSEVS